MYRPTGNFRYLVQELVVSDDISVKSEPKLQQEYQCMSYGNLEWRDIDIVIEKIIKEESCTK